MKDKRNDNGLSNTLTRTDRRHTSANGILILSQGLQIPCGRYIRSHIRQNGDIQYLAHIRKAVGEISSIGQRNRTQHKNRNITRMVGLRRPHIRLHIGAAAYAPDDQANRCRRFERHKYDDRLKRQQPAETQLKNVETMYIFSFTGNI